MLGVVVTLPHTELPVFASTFYGALVGSSPPWEDDEPSAPPTLLTAFRVARATKVMASTSRRPDGLFRQLLYARWRPLDPLNLREC